MPVVYVVFFGLAGASLKLVSTQLVILFAAADIESLRGVFWPPICANMYTCMQSATCSHI